MPSNQRPKIACLGLWHLGSVISCCLASRGSRVTGYDPDALRVSRLSSAQPPLYEPGLSERLRTEVARGRLSFTSDLGEAVRDADLILLTFDTPVDDTGRSDLSPLFAAVQGAAKLLKGDRRVTLVVFSQVAVGTCERLAKAATAARPGLRLGVVCCPENLRLGQALAAFEQAAFYVVGAKEPEDLARAAALFEGFPGRVLTMGLRSAEMVKHALNGILALSVAYGNELARLSEAAGADALEVVEGLRADPRVGVGLPLRPGLGFSGGTLARDVRTLTALAAEGDVQAPLIGQILRSNKTHNESFIERLEIELKTLRGKRLCLLGLTYKAGTSTVRGSLPIILARRMIRKGAKLSAYDPKADLGELGPIAGLAIAPDAYAAGKGAEAAVILTDWPEFKKLDLRHLKRVMRSPLIYDTRNMLDPARARAQGFRYIGVGRNA